MKKVLLTIATAAVMLVGCNSDVDIRPINTQKLADFYGEISAETRTQLTENQSDNTSYAAWVDGEFISIFYLSNPNNQYKVCDISNEGKNARFTPTGVFTDVTDADYKDFSKHYAIYPYSENNKMFEEGVITTILPATQTYNPESNLAYVPMVASSENTSLSFVIPTSLMRVSVSRNNPLRSTLKQIILSSENADIPLAGEIEFDMNGANVVTTVKGTENAIVLDLGEGVAITTEAVDYYISLPPVTFPAKNAMTVTLVYTQGNTTKQYVKTWSDKELVFNAGDRKGTSIVLSLEDFNGSTAYPATGGELVGNLTLTTDMNIKQPLTVPAGEEATINLNGKNITAGTFAESNGAVTEGTTDSYAFWVKEGAKLTINGDGKVKTDACKYSMAVWAQGGEVIINGGYYENAGEGSDLIYASAGSKIIINGGEFKACPKQPGVEGTAEEYSALNLKDNTGSQIIVYGGKFHNFDPANNTSEGAGTNFVAEGYISVETSENVWEVFPANEPVEVATAAALEDVLAQGGEATLTNDINLENTAIVITEGEATIDLNGKTITGGLFAESSGAITEGTTDSYVFWVKGGTLNIKGDGTVKSQSATYSIAVWADGGTVNIENGKFYNEGHGSDLIYAKNNGIVNIYGGYFEACKSDHTEDGTQEDYSALNLHGTYPGTITVYGGQFFGFDPANNASENPKISFVAEGYYSVEVSDGVYEVVSATEIAGKTVCVASYDELKSVLAQGGSVKLTENISTNEIIVVSGSATIDGNGKTLTSSAGRAINLSGADGATIKNLTIEASGERAINIIQKSTNITIEGVTATASKYTVNIASSAPNAVVTINDSTFTGLNTINVSGVGAKVTIDNSTVNCNDNNSTTGESYAALCLNKDGIGGSIIATNCTINVTEGSDSTKGRNGAEDGTVTINGSTDDVTVINAVITFEGSDNYYGYESLADAIELAKNGNTITLIRNTVVEESVVILADKEIIIDLNGKTISQKKAKTTDTAYAMIENKGTLTIKDSVGGGKVSYADTTVYTADHNYASNTISNKGTLTIESGIIENISSDNVMTYGYPHAIDVYPGSVTNIKGGTVKSVNYDCIRMFCNSTTVATTVNISGGNIINRVSFQNPSSNQAGYGRLNITGGTFTSTVGKSNVRLLNFSTDVSNMKAEITGGTFDQGVSISNYSSWTADWNWLTIGDGVTIKKLL